MKALVAGWFSFEGMGATAGDLLARDVACQWLQQAGFSYEVAVASPFIGGIDWHSADPARYSHVVFVCGPFGNGWPVSEFLAHFADCRVVGLDVSMLEPLDAWNPFDLLLERESTAAARPDISFVSSRPLVPVVGVVLVHGQKEYPDGLHQQARDAVDQLFNRREVASLVIDTRLDVNSAGLRTPAQVESLIARTDVVVTTRLHGMVLALKNGVPAIVIDPIRGGAKVRRQAETIGWPLIYAADRVTAAELADALDFCLTGAARRKARQCSDDARRRLRQVQDEFITGLAGQRKT
jgi:hypothetical protein